MRVALISFCPPGNQKTAEILRRLGESAAQSGNQIDRIDGNVDLSGTRLTAYDYIAVVAVPVGAFGGKVSPRVAEYLEVSGNVVSKKGCALVIKSAFGSEGACHSLMDAMESQGIKLDYFDVIRDLDHAVLVGKKIG